MSMSVSSGFAVITQPKFEGYPPLLSSGSFTSHQGDSPSSLLNGKASPLSLAQRSLKSLTSAFEDEDDEQRLISSPKARETRSSSLIGWFRGGSEDAKLSPRRFSLFHPIAAASNNQPEQQRGSNHRASVSSQVTPTPSSAVTQAPIAPSNLTCAPPLSLQSHPPSSQPLPALNTPALSLTYPQRPSETMRSVTPPPTIIDKQVEEAEDDDDGWVSISTVNMSPFMILRIKALIELASVEPTSSGSEPTILLKVMTDDSVKLKSCLKNNQNAHDEISRLERARLSVDSDDGYVTLLNDLLEAARQKTSTPSIAQINESYRNQYQMAGRMASPSRSRTRLSFSEGASLLCFDSSEKPRRVKDNHKRHFAKFLSYQRSASANAKGLTSSAPSLLGVPNTSAPSPAPFNGGISTNVMSTSPQVPSPSSNSTQTPPPSPTPSQLSSGSSTPTVTNAAGSVSKTAASPPPPMPPIRPLSQSAPAVPRHVSPRLTEAFVSSIASNTSASAAVLASVLQGDTPDLRVYGQTVKTPPKPLTALLQRQVPRRLSASANSIYGGAPRNP